MKLSLSEKERRQKDHQSIPLESEDQIVEAWHRLSYDAARKGLTWHASRWKGYPVYKLPSDLWLYAELLWELKPRTIIETGTADGGSALFFADTLATAGVRHYVVITMDIRPLNVRWPAHESILYVPEFNSVDWPPKRGQYVDGMQITIPPQLHPPVLVVLDSDHSETHVHQELEVYAHLVSEGSYLVVEDTNVNGHPVLPEHGPGPAEALARWLPEHPEFREDRARARKQLLSYHTWLRKIASP